MYTREVAVSPAEEVAAWFAARARSEREARARDAAEVLARVSEVARRLLPRKGRAWLIGSLAWGGFGAHSDVDLVLDGVDSDVALALERAVSATANRPVDVLELAELSEGLRGRVELEGLALHGA